MKVSSDEETFRRLALELRILEGTADAIQSRSSMVNAALTELVVAGMTLEGLEKEKKDAPLFVPIGGGSYIEAKLGSEDKVVVSIGAGVAIERTLKEAKDTVTSRIAELEKTRTTLEQQLRQVIEKIQDNRAQLQEMSAKLSEGEKAAGV
jgi:prefoldin alpha subunit